MSTTRSKQTGSEQTGNKRTDRWTLLTMVAVLTLLTSATATALDSSKPGKQVGSQEPSMDEVARMIRQEKKWQILDARSRQDGSTVHYRFKLINSTGKIRIINIDPRKPNLRRLE